MRIDFGCGDGFVSQHFLHGPQVGSAFDQMGCKGMPERVRRDPLPQIDLDCQILDDREDHDPSQSPAAVIEKDEVFEPVLDRLMVSNLCRINLQVLGGDTPDRYQAFFVALSDDLQEPDLEVEVRQLEVDQLANAKSAGVKCFQHRLVSDALGLAQVDGCNQAVNVIDLERIRQLSPEFRGFQELGGIILCEIFQQAVLEE